ncbi:MAG: DUF1343 domain-containing protein [Tannerellaceae bacterium]|nr:DUF1343 domain-containing protein [Tannerellaceae bacterium]
MKRKTIFAGCLFQILSLAAKTTAPPVPGAEQIDLILHLVDGKRVGLVVNQTSVLGNPQRTHLLDTLLARGVEVRKIFAPEHGFRGTAEAGEWVNSHRDASTGLPVLSIYGKNKKPSAEQLRGIDLLIFDIQDVGVRFYTYISTMHYVMEACAENNKECIVLDRPNPNDYIDGPMRKEGFESFVGLDLIPVLHGLTVGELAQMINGERWLRTNPDRCKLRVVPLKNWSHGDPYLLPVAPSPNLPNHRAVRLYPSLGWFEATDVSIGRGTPFPFQVIGYPDRSCGDFSFTPHPMEGMDMNPLQNGRACFGLDLREYPFEGGLTLRFFLDFYRKTGGKASFFSRPEWFDLLAGNDELRNSITSGLSEQEIRLCWEKDLKEYKVLRRKYLLYPDER